MVEHLLARIAELDGALGSFVEVDAAGARAAAAESDRRIDGSRSLEGIPVAIKSNIAAAGLRWSAGMAARRDTVATSDAEVVVRLRAAGAIILGTSAMDEAALGATGDNPWFGRVANPHAPERSPGGSSAGSAAAVAAGLCVAALGTDTLGSIRIPAAYTGVYGFKPCHGEVTTSGVFALARAFDAVGVLARSVDDVELVSAVLAPWGEPAGTPAVATLAHLGGVECQPAVLAGYHRALDALGGASHEVALPAPAAALRVSAFIAAARELRGRVQEVPGDLLSPRLHRLLDYGARVEPAPDMLRRVRDRLLHDLAGRVLLLPAVPHTAFLHGHRPPANQADFTVLASIAGLAALAVPAGHDAAGLPVGVQLVGAPGSEGGLFAAARTLDARLRAYAAPPAFS